MRAVPKGMGREVTISRTIALKAGDSLVWLKLESMCTPKPFGMDIRYSKGEYTELSNHSWELAPGDVLSFPHEYTQAWVVVLVKTVGLWAQWDQMLARRFPGYPMSCPALRLSFLMTATCPHCGTSGQHDAEMVDMPTTEDRTSIARRYVVRTCLTCDNSWEQETQW